MSFQRQQQQLSQIVNQGLRNSLNYSQSTAKLSLSLNQVAQLQSPTHKTNQSQGQEPKKAVKKHPSSNQSAVQQNHYQMELLKLMTSNPQTAKKKEAAGESVNRSNNNQTQFSVGRTNSPPSERKKSKFNSTDRAAQNSLSPKGQGYYMDRKVIQKNQRPSVINSTIINNLSMQIQINTSQNLKGSAKRFFSNERKATPSTEPEPLDIFTVILHVNATKTQFKIDARKNTDYLEKYLLEEIKKQLPKKSQEPVAICSLDKNLPLDYYLQLTNRPLLLFKDQTLNIQPFFNEEENKSNKIGLKDFKFLKCIGVGGFSRVYLVKRKATGRIFAMKLIDKEFIMKNRKQGIVQNERDIMTVLDHPFITKLEHSFESQNFVVFVLEFCSGGELFWQLRQVKRMKEEDARFYFTEICLGMLYLHSLNVVYRDIKPENILIDIDGHVRIADFGLSKPNMGEEDYAYSFCGSPEYMAPEMLLKIGHNVQVDHYCLGALLYELVTGLPPYYSRDTNQIYESILNEELTFPDKVQLSPDIKDLLTGLLNKQPQERLGYEGGIAQLLQHPWIRGVNFVAILDKQVKPPFIPNQLKFNFDSNELTKGELEAREKLIGRTGLTQDINIFDSFYFDQSEQKQMKIQQKKIYAQHRSYIAQQQALIQARYSTKSTSVKKKAQNSFENLKVVQAPPQMSQLQKRIQQQNSRQQNSGVPSPSPQQKANKMIGLKRIISQNNFLVDHQMTMPSGSLSKGDNSAFEFSLLGYKHMGTELSETKQQLMHKRVSSLKQKRK